MKHKKRVQDKKRITRAEKVQSKKRPTRKVRNMDNVQHEKSVALKSATWNEYNIKQHGKSATWKKYNTEKIQLKMRTRWKKYNPKRV